MPMKEPKRILFISQEIYPYIAEETPTRLLNRQLPEFFQGHGFETRTFMPKFGEINERRNQLHEVIRLSLLSSPHVSRSISLTTMICSTAAKG